MRKYLVGILFFLSLATQAQELQCSVSVVSPSIQSSNKQVYETLQTAIREFMNAQQWTDHVYSSEERIECSILINITDVVADQYTGTIQIQARRPVYNSSYNTILLNYLDQDFGFEYVEFQPLIYNPNTFDSDLVGVLAYYANLIIGLDYDSFSKYGGDKYAEQAESIVSLAQSSSQTGWRSYDSNRNRYWLIENYLNEIHKSMREAMYQYHRLGLDKMSEDLEEARGEILSALQKLQKVHRKRPGTFAMTVFFDAKNDELVNVFSEASDVEKKQALEVLLEIDPSNSSKYNESLSEK